MYIIYDAFKNEKTYRFNGSEWIIDGEIGRMIYPGYWDKSMACCYYANGWGHDHKWEVVA